MFGKILDAIDGFARWVDRRFGMVGDEIPADLCVCWDNFWRIIDYIPILWHDYDFSCSPGIFTLIKKKLERLEPELVHSINAERDRKRVRICIKLLDKVINNYYEDQFHKKHDAKWGEAQYRWIDFDDENDELLIKRPKANTPAEKEQETKELLAGVDWYNRQKQNATDYCMKFIAKWAQHLWD
jgi:hypothetical protein